MDGIIQQVPVMTSSDTSNTLEQTNGRHQIESSALSGTAAAISREAGDKLEPQMKTLSLAAMVDSMDDEASQDHHNQQQQQQHEIIGQQTALQGQSLSAADKPIRANEPAITTTLNQQTDPHILVDEIPAIDECNAGSNISTTTGNYSTTTTLNNPKPPQLQPPPHPQTQSTTKLNGLKNRHRPPPLVLDKVSNFYDNDTNSPITQPQRQQPHQQQESNIETQPNSVISNLLTSNRDKLDYNNYSRHNTRSNQYQNQNQINQVKNVNQIDDIYVSDQAPSNISNNNNNSNSNNNNNANQKFWASLNENASRNKALANARSISTTATLNELQPSNANRDNSNINSNLLGPDLIIKQRNSTGNIASSRLLSTLSARKQRHSNIDAYHTIDESYNSTKNDKHGQEEPHRDSHHEQLLSQEAAANHLNHSDDLDECLVTGESNAGGNLIGVDNITPPVTELRDRGNQHQSDEPPPSATGSRPRSNNPFLDDNDEDFEVYRNSIRSGSANRGSFSSQNDNSFQKRPASFIAATDRMTGFTKPSYDFAAKQRIVEEKLSELQVNDNSTANDQINSINIQQYQMISAPPLRPPPDQLDSQATYEPLMGQLPTISHYGQFYRSKNNNQTTGMVTEPKISLDSESAVCQPPPSATMQLPHWSEAIYELNNAILETSSIAGGAENGMFIYISESGDIILELDTIKVSGFTLTEFNELVDSKQFHLLKAVQTKHSHGLMLELKDYLAMSFPKESKDKKLQSVIRDNIYRQTIPCTTRPPRAGEVDKVDYHFMAKEQFMELNRVGALLECGVYVGHYYGTLKPSCDLKQLLSNLPHVADPKYEPYGGKMRRAWDANHPAVEMIMKKDASLAQSVDANTEHPLYENHESLRMQQPHSNQLYMPTMQPLENTAVQPASNLTGAQVDMPRVVEALPQGWERVSDQTHGTYYIDHNTQRTQYERPYEVELTKGSMGFGFTLVEADSGLLLVRSVIPGGPAHMNGLIRPGDILISAVGVSVTGLQHTDIARLFSTFAVGDRVRLTFARSNYVLDENLIPDEYLFSNGTNGDLAIAVNPNNYQLTQDMAQNPHILVNQEFEFIKVTLKRGDQGFGFTISDSIAGQKVRKIQNHEICSNLKQGDILINLNGEDITKMTHKEVVERLKQCPPGEDVALTIKRKKRFRSKTPMAMHTDASEGYSLDSTPQRNCKTPSLDGLMLRHPANYNSRQQSVATRSLFQAPIPEQHPQQPAQGTLTRVADLHTVANGLPATAMTNSFELHSHRSSSPSNNLALHLLYGENIQHMSRQAGQINFQHGQHPLKPLMLTPSDQVNDLIHAPSNMRPNSNQSSDVLYRDNASNSVQASEASVTKHPTTYHPGLPSNDFNQVNQYNNFMNNDKLMMMQMQQPIYQQQQIYSSDYHQVPLYSNSEVIDTETIIPQSQLGGPIPALPVKQTMNQYWQMGGVPVPVGSENFQNNFYANNEEIALQSMQYGYLQPSAGQVPPPAEQFTFMRPISHGTPHDEHDEFEYHTVDLERENTDSNWGIRLIGGAEVDRAISIGSMIFGGVAAKSGNLKSGDEIISIDGVNVIGATHKHVVDLISACTNRVSLVVRRKTFAEACDVVLTKNMDEGFGFVIISNENCALIGKIIEGSPADRCKQLRVRDCIIAVNGRYITPDMKHPEIVNMIKDCGSTLRLRIIPVDCYTVKLIKDVQNDSFGFRMRGGSEYDGTPLYIVRVEPNGQAQGLLNVGDQILEINNIPTVGMTHQQAATIIKYSDPIVKLKLRRNYVTPPSLMVDSPRSLQKYNQTAEMKHVNLASTPTNVPSSHDTSFTSLPPNISLMSQKFHQPNLQPAYQGNQSDPAQSIYDRHPMTYVDQGSLYAT